MTLHRHLLLLACLVAMTSTLPALAPGAAEASVKVGQANGTLLVESDEEGDKIRLALAPGDSGRVEVDVGAEGRPDVGFSRGSFNKIVSRMGGGGDLFLIDESNGAFTDTEITTLLGDEGEDILQGGTGSELLVGGAGADQLVGSGGDDAVFGGEDGDFFAWQPGDGGDAVEGQAGVDTLLVMDSTAPELVDVSASGPKLRITRTFEKVSLHAAGVEAVDVTARGGLDEIAVHDLSGTGVAGVRVGLGGAQVEGPADRVRVDGTNAADTATVAASGEAVAVTGLAAPVRIVGSQPRDSLRLRGLDGDDALTGGLGLATRITTTLDGDAGADTLVGGDGSDILFGGDGDDRVDGEAGDDVAALGAGHDRFVWNAGDGSDRLEGDEGTDAVEVNGGNGADVVKVGRPSSLVRVESTGPAPFALNLGTLEGIDVRGAGGDDVLTAEPGLPAGLALTLDGGPGVDAIRGGENAETLLGGSESDTVDGGPGDDALRGGSGDDGLSGGAGDDKLTGDEGQDALTGGTGADVFECDGPAEAQDIAAADSAQAICLAPVPPGPVPATPGSPAPTPATAPGPQAVRPVLSRLTISPGRLVLGGLLPKLVAKPARRPVATIGFALSAPSRVELRFAKLGPGGTVRRLRSTVRLNARQGVNRVRFTGRLSRKVRLAPGAYRLTAVAIDRTGARSAPVSRAFTARRRG